MQSSFRIHAAYVITFLVIVIIFLVSNRFGDDANLTNYINFALGLTSFVLGIVAIFHSILSNSSFNQTVSKIESAAALVKEETRKLEGSVSIFNTHLTTLPTAFQSAASLVKDETVKLEDAVKVLNANLNTIPDALQTLQGQVAASHELLKASTQPPATPVTQTEIDPSRRTMREIAVEFIRRSSWDGFKTIYLAYLASNKNQIIDLNKIFANGSPDFSYSYGYLVSASAVGFFRLVVKGMYIYEINSMLLTEEDFDQELSLRYAHPIFSEDLMKKDIEKLVTTFNQIT